MDAAERAGVEALVEAASAADGVGPLSEHARLHLRRGGGLDLVRRSDRGDVVGYAHLDPEDGAPATAELVVHPDARRLGHGTALAGELERAAGPAGLRVWAHGQLPGAVGLAAALGFVPVRELWQMRRELAGPDAAPLPDGPELDGLRLRPFRVGADEQAWLAVNARAFAAYPEQGGWTIDDLTDREGAPWFDPAGFLLLEGTDGRLAGFHWTKQHPQPGTAPLGEVYVVGLDPAYQGRGLGPALTLAGLRHLAAAGSPAVILYVDGANAAAIATYRRLGFTRSSLDVMYARE